MLQTGAKRGLVFDFDLEGHVRSPFAHATHDFGDFVTRRDAIGEPVGSKQLPVILFHHGEFGQVEAVILASPTAHRVLLESAQPGQGLAGIEYVDTGCQFRPGTHPRRNAREVRQNIQGRSLGTQRTPRIQRDAQDLLSCTDFTPVDDSLHDLDVGIEHPEALHSGQTPRQNSVGLCGDLCPNRGRVLRKQSGGGRVFQNPVLFKAAPNPFVEFLAPG